MLVSHGSHAARRGPQPAHRIIEFRTREKAAVASSSSDEHLAVGQERRGIVDSRGRHAAGRGPQPGRRIIEFRTREIDAAVAKSPSDEHLAVGQERRGMAVSCRGEAAGGRPGPALTRARLYQHQPSSEQNQPERDPPRQNQAGRPETTDQSVKAVSSGFVIVRPSDPRSCTE